VVRERRNSPFSEAATREATVGEAHHAIVKPGTLDDVTRAVTDAGAHGMTVTEVRGFGQQHGHQVADGRPVRMLPKLRIDVAVADELAAALVDAIAKSVETGTIGDGKIWVCPLESALRVRTGERDQAAV
jgi:nitrogen regulatory protein PII